MITADADVPELGTILGIWAHPDDEAYLSGGLMAVARDSGARVVLVTATRGERGTTDPVAWPPARLAEVRTAELARCLEHLGVREHHWLGFEDGSCPAVDETQAVASLCSLLDEVRPDTVLTFGPDGITGHPDHQAVSRWAGAAFRRAAPPGSRLLHAAVGESRLARWGDLDERLGVYLPGYPVTTPEPQLAVDLVLDTGTAARKVRALAAQATQTAALIDALGADRYTAWVSQESFREADVAPGRRGSDG